MGWHPLLAVPLVGQHVLAVIPAVWMRMQTMVRCKLVRVLAWVLTVLVPTVLVE